MLESSFTRGVEITLDGQANCGVAKQRSDVRARLVQTMWLVGSKVSVRTAAAHDAVTVATAQRSGHARDASTHKQATTLSNEKVAGHDNRQGMCAREAWMPRNGSEQCSSSPFCCYCHFAWRKLQPVFPGLTFVLRTGATRSKGQVTVTEPWPIDGSKTRNTPAHAEADGHRSGSCHTYAKVSGVFKITEWALL